jgi:uncharacterized protein (TIGR03067 family)
MRSKLLIGFAALLIAGGAFIAGMLVERHFLVVQPATGTSELDGTWQAVRMELEDGISNNAAASVTRLTIAGEKIKQSGMIGDIDGFITTDATQNPKTFDAGGIRGAGKEAVSMNWSGIYEREGDTLKLCFSTAIKGERPKEFKSKPAMLLILKRVKS